MKAFTTVFVILFAILLVLGLASPFIQNGNMRDVTVTVTDKVRTGGEDSKYLIFTEDPNGQILVFENTDKLLRGKFNSSDMYARIHIGETYTFTVIGYRIQPLSWYPNIIGIRIK